MDFWNQLEGFFSKKNLRMWRKSGDDVCSAVALLPNLMHWSKGGLVFGELGENLEKLENLTKAR